MGSPLRLVGAAAVAETFNGRAKGAVAAMVGGCVGVIWSIGGKPQMAFDLVIIDHVIVAIEMVADPLRLEQFDITRLPRRAADPA
jgi:RNA polymerase sigma-70 factor (ECF subfamily)